MLATLWLIGPAAAVAQDALPPDGLGDPPGPGLPGLPGTAGGGEAPAAPQPRQFWPEGASLQPVEPGGRPEDTLGRLTWSGRGHWPRVSYQAPPFDGDDYWVPGGVVREPDPQKFLAPIDLSWVLDGAGQMGPRFEVRLLGNSLISGGFGFWGIADPDDYGGILKTAPRVDGVWRTWFDVSALLWVTPQIGFEIGPFLGAEKDILTVGNQKREIGFIWGFVTRARIWRATLRADWMMRLDNKHDLGYGDLRHALMLQADIEVIRLDRFGLLVGAWTQFISGGKPRGGFHVGLRFWISSGRDRPDWGMRYGTDAE